MGWLRTLSLAGLASVVLGCTNRSLGPVESLRTFGAADTPITRASTIDSFTMHVKSELTVPIDFPASAFIRVR